MTRLILSERLGQTAPLIAREIDAELSRWEAAASPVEASPLPPLSTRLEFGPAGVIRASGELLAYYPVVPSKDVPDDERLRRGQRAEFEQRDLDAAIAAYQEAASSTGQTVRAVALAGLGRCLRTRKKLREALEAYGELTKVEGGRITGFPAPLVASRERQAIFQAMGDVASAERERVNITGDLLARKYIIDRPTFDAFAPALASGEYPADAVARAEAIVEFWTQFLAARTGRTAGGSFAAVWRGTAESTVAIVAPIDVLMAPSLASARRLSTDVALERPDGQLLWRANADGQSHAIGVPVVGLPFILRLSTTDANAASDSRERLFIAGFVLLSLVVTISAYFVFRSPNREVGVATSETS